MILPRYARRFYKLVVDADDPDPTWEASFDNGATWVTGEPFTDPDEGAAWRWLVAGPDADPGLAVAVITASVTPKLRDVDSTEIEGVDGRRIWLT